MKYIQEVRRKIGEATRRHPRLTTIAAASALGLTALEIIGYAQNPTYDIPDDACISPPALSWAYDGDPTVHPLEWNSGVLTSGVLASGDLPAGAYGVVASFRHPEEGMDALRSNASDMLHADAAGHYALKMARGNGAVQFGVSFAASKDSELCNTAPDVRYDDLDKSDFLMTAATAPWPNPGSVFFGLIA